MKGRYSSGRATEESLLTATGYFMQSIERDPSNPLAYAGLADSTLLLGGFGDVPPSETAARAEAAAKKALSLDPELSDAHVSLAWVRFSYNWNWRVAEAEFRRAIALDPSNAAARHGLGMLLLALGRFDESRSALARAAELDPVSLMIATNRGLPDLFERRYDAAMNQFRSALALDPTFVPARVNLGYALLLTGRCEEAEREFATAVALGHQEPEAILIRAFAATVHGSDEDAMRIMRELETLTRRQGVYPFRAALLYALIGQRTAAFRWLERGYAERSPDMVYLETHPIADQLRGDPRFDELLARIGLVPRTRGR
jgi:serine/threonine-protein kinase